MAMASTFPQRLTEINALMRLDHWHLKRSDVCHFLGEYRAGKGYRYNATNGLILDFKMSVLNAGLPVWREKEAVIATAAAALRQAMHPSVLDQVVFVPMPPSQAKGNAGYDDRLARMLRAVRPGRPLDVRELLVQTRSTELSHQRPARLRVSEIEAMYRIDEALEAPGADVVAVVDDLLTSGGALPGGERDADAALSRHRSGGGVPGAAGAGGGAGVTGLGAALPAW